MHLPLIWAGFTTTCILPLDSSVHGNFRMVPPSKWMQNYLPNSFRSPFKNGILDAFTVFPLPYMDILIKAAVAQEPLLIFSECREGRIARTLIVWEWNKILPVPFYTDTRQPCTTHWFEDAPLYLPGCFTLQHMLPLYSPYVFGVLKK